MAVTTKGQVESYRDIESRDIKDVIETIFDPKEADAFEKQKYEVKDNGNTKIFTFDYVGLSIRIEVISGSLLEPGCFFTISKYGEKKPFQVANNENRIKDLLFFFKRQYIEDITELKKKDKDQLTA